MSVVEASVETNSFMRNSTTEVHMPLASGGAVDGAPPQSAGAAAPVAPLLPQAPETSVVDRMQSDRPCRHVRCGTARWISSTGLVTTQCWVHNVDTYYGNITFGGQQMLHLCSDESRYLVIDNTLTAAIERLITERAKLRGRWGPHQQ